MIFFSITKLYNITNYLTCNLEFDSNIYGQYFIRPSDAAAFECTNINQ